MQWKDIEGYEGFYQVSSAGTVRSITRRVSNPHRTLSFLKGKQLKVATVPRGYRLVVLQKDGRAKTFRVARLVASAFLKKPSSKIEVNHKDGVRDNDSLDNLEWVSRSQNALHAYKLGLQKQGNEHGKAVSVSQFVKVGIRDSVSKVATFGTITEASRITGIERTNISRTCVKNRLFDANKYSAGGFIWRYNA